MISLGWGSWNIRLISAWPLSRDLIWRLAGLPCLQKFVTWENMCWAKHWAEAVHCVGAIPGPADPYIGHRPYAGPLELAGSDGPRVSKCHCVTIVRRRKIYPEAKIKKN